MPLRANLTMRVATTVLPYVEDLKDEMDMENKKKPNVGAHHSTPIPFTTDSVLGPMSYNSPQKIKYVDSKGLGEIRRSMRES